MQITRYPTTEPFETIFRVQARRREVVDAFDFIKKMMSSAYKRSVTSSTDALIGPHGKLSMPDNAQDYILKESATLVWNAIIET